MTATESWIFEGFAVDTLHAELDALCDGFVAILRRQVGCTRHVAELSVAGLRAGAHAQLDEHLADGRRD